VCGYPGSENSVPGFEQRDGYENPEERFMMGTWILIIGVWMAGYHLEQIPFQTEAACLEAREDLIARYPLWKSKAANYIECKRTK
jgi:hypothetical protein